MKTISVTEGRKCLGTLVDHARYLRHITALGKYGHPEALIIPFPEAFKEIPITEINATSESFSFLENEPDLYSIQDLKKPKKHV